MAYITLSPPDFTDYGNMCPCCLGPVEVEYKVDNLILVHCDHCTWADMFEAVYHIHPADALSPY